MNKTGIEWCDYSWNPITGCSPESEGCEHCYAKAMAETRLRGRCGYDIKDPFAVKFHRDRLREPFVLKKPSTIFVCSMSDLFHEKLMLSDIGDVFDTISSTPWHTYFILTKRIFRLQQNCTLDYFLQFFNGKSFPANLWIGVTAENQARADERIPVLMQIPAKHRFVSVEPMLGPVDLTEIRNPHHEPGACYTNVLYGKEFHEDDHKCSESEKLDWVICGAETGPGARTMSSVDAIRLRNSCKDAGVPFFFKKVTKGNVLPDELKVREFPDFWEARGK